MDDVKEMLSRMVVTAQLATETSPGDPVEIEVGPKISRDDAIEWLRAWIEN